MFVNAVPVKNTSRKLLVIQERYLDENGKKRTRTVEKVGFLDELEKEYDDPIAHFKLVAKEKTEEKNKNNDNVVTITFNKDAIMHFDERMVYDITMKTGNIPIGKVIHKLRLDGFLDSRRKRTNCEFNLTNLFRLLIYERLLEPGSKLSDWRNRDRYYEKMKFEVNQIYSGLQKLASWKEPILKHLNNEMIKQYGRESGYGYGLFDGTNIYYEIENEDGFKMRGNSKEKRYDLPIVQMGLLLDSQGFPISYDIYEGNTNDSQMLIPAMNRARKEFNLNSMIYVADSAFSGSDNTADIIINHDGYVMSRSVKGTSISEELRKKVLSPQGYECYTVDGALQKNMNEDTEFMYKVITEVKDRKVTNVDGEKKNVKNIGRMYIAYWSRKYYERAKADRAAKIEKAMLMSKSKSKKKIDNRHGELKFMKTEIYDKSGNIVKDYEAQIKFDQEAIEDDERTDGFYLIETNLAGRDWFDDTLEWKPGQTSRWRESWSMLQLNRELTPMDIVSIYRGLWQIENTFKILKSNLQLRPAFVSTRESIEGHFLICFIALLILRILEKEAGGKYTTGRVLEALRKSKVAEISPHCYKTIYYDGVLMDLSRGLNIRLNQSLYTQNDIKMLFAQTRKE